MVLHWVQMGSLGGGESGRIVRRFKRLGDIEIGFDFAFFVFRCFRRDEVVVVRKFSLVCG